MKPGVGLVAAALAIAFLGGCAFHYTPDASRPLESIPEFTSNASIALVNGQHATDEVLWERTLNGYSYYGDLSKWTDTAIGIAAREMKQCGMTISDRAPKSIEMSIVSANGQNGMIQFELKVTMNVRTSDGYTATYVGRNTSEVVANVTRQADGAVMRAVHEMLMDPKIVEFLKKP